jgi:hypothetical protein
VYRVTPDTLAWEAGGLLEVVPVVSERAQSMASPTRAALPYRPKGSMPAGAIHQPAPSKMRVVVQVVVWLSVWGM